MVDVYYTRCRIKEVCERDKVEFCPTCEMVMRIKTEEGAHYLTCQYCGGKKELPFRKLETSMPRDDRPSTIEIVKEDIQTHCKTQLSCKRCNLRKVYSIGTEEVCLFRNYKTFVLYRCFGCGFRWREEIIKNLN